MGITDFIKKALFSSTNKTITELQKEINYLRDLSMQRPSLDYLQQLGTGGIRIPFFPLSPRVLKDVAMYSDVIRNILSVLNFEIFKNGIEIKEQFVVKCTNEACGKEFQHIDEDMRCDICGAPLRVPDIKQKDILIKFLERSNENGETLQETLETFENDLNIFDDAYLLVLKEYEFANNVLIKATPKEIIAVTALNVKIVADKTGRPARDDDGRPITFCIRHRDKKQHSEFCSECGLQTFPAYYEVIGPQDKKLYYGENEMYHTSKYFPSYTYGHSPLYAVWQKVVTLLNMDKYMKDYYGRQRPPRGLLFINTANADSFEKAWFKLLEETKKDPHVIHPIPIENIKGKNIAEFIDFMHSLDEMQYTEVRQEFRRTIAAVYGVMPLFEGDITTSGGLNVEREQIQVQNRVLQKAQTIYNEKLFVWLCKQLGVTDYIYKLGEVEHKTEKEQEELRALKIQNALLMKQLGFEVDINEDGEFEFKRIKKFVPETAETSEVTQEPLGEPEIQQTTLGKGESIKSSIQNSLQKEIFLKTLEDIEKDEGVNIVLKKDLSDYLSELNNTLFTAKFADMSKRMSEIIKKIILDGFTNNVDPVVIRDTIARRARISKEDAERIVRTEIQALQNKAKELIFRETDPEGKNLYKRVGPEDFRLCKACKKAIERTKKGVTLDEMLKIVKEVAKEEFGSDAYVREHTLHPNDRCTFIRVFQ